MLFSNRDLRKLLIPLVLEQLLAMLVGSMDTLMVSSCGEAAVSAVSLVDTINIFLICMFSALATGGAVVTAQYLGRKEPENATRAAKQLYYVVLVISAVLGAFCVLLRDPILRLVFGRIDDEVMVNARVYFLITAASYPFLAMYNASAALLRAEGNSKDSLITSAIVNVVNVAGNALLIFVCRMGVMGAALATLFSRIIGAFIMLRMTDRPENLYPAPKLLAFEWNGRMVKSILKIGVPSGCENSYFQLGKLLLLSLVSTFGTASIAANALANTVCGFQVIPGNSVSLALITVIGRCIGAGDIKQARYYTRQLMKKCYLYMGIVNLVIAFLNPWIVDPFNVSPEAARMARQVILLHGIACIIDWPLSFTLPNVLRAAGDTVFTMTVSTVSMTVFRIVTGYILAQVFQMGLMGVWVAMQIDWIFRSSWFVWRYLGHRWETRRVISDS